MSGFDRLGLSDAVRERVAALGVEVIGLLAIAVFSPVPDAKDVSPRPHRRGVSLSR